MKVRLQITSELYLQQHPEFRGMIKAFCEQILEKKVSNEDVLNEAIDFFTDPELKQKLELQSER